MKKFNFAVIALICLARIEADEGSQQPIPKKYEKKGEKAQIKKRRDDPSEADRKYQKLLLTLNALTESLEARENKLIASLDKQSVSNKSSQSLPEQTAKADEPSAAKIAYKNQVRYGKNKITGKKQSKLVNQEVVITLTKEFFEKEENKSLNFSPGFDSDAVIKISYEKNGDKGSTSKQNQVAEKKDSKPAEVAFGDSISSSLPALPKMMPPSEIGLPASSEVNLDTKIHSHPEDNSGKLPESSLRSNDDVQPKPSQASLSETPVKPVDKIEAGTEKDHATFWPKIEKLEMSADTQEFIAYVSAQNSNPQINHVPYVEKRQELISVPLHEATYAEERPVYQQVSESYQASSVTSDNSSEPYVYTYETDCCDNSCIHLPTLLNLGYTFGHGIETNHNYATANLMVFPWAQQNLVPFLSLSAHLLDNNKWAGSYGAGLRWQPQGACHVWGFNAFYDTLKKHLGTFHQVGLGAEYLSETWEARVNAYLPTEGKYKYKTVKFWDDYEGNYWARVSRLEQTQRGFDAELGYNTYFCSDYRFYIGAGPAWFEEYRTNNNAWAFKARGLVQWSEYLSLEVRTFKEKNNSWQWQGAVFLTIPFECVRDLCSCGFTDLFTRPVYRNGLIKSDSKCCWETNY